MDFDTTTWQIPAVNCAVAIVIIGLNPQLIKTPERTLFSRSPFDGNLNYSTARTMKTIIYCVTQIVPIKHDGESPGECFSNYTLRF